MLESVVEDAVLDLDEPDIVAEEDGGCFGAYEARDAREGVLFAGGEGGYAVDERVGYDEVGEVAEDVVADFGGNGAEGEGRG